MSRRTQKDLPLKPVQATFLSLLDRARHQKQPTIFLIHLAYLYA